MIAFAALLNSISDLLPGAVIDIDDSLTLAEAALEEDDPVLERARLATRGFVHGRHRRWVADAKGVGGPIVVSLTVHEFATVQQAVLSVADLRERLRAAAVTDLRSTPNSIEAVYPDEDGAALACVSRTTGPFQVVIAARCPSTTPDGSTLALAIANLQIAGITSSHPSRKPSRRQVSDG